MRSILISFFILFFSAAAYCSNDNHLLIRASEFTFELRWDESISEFENPASSFELIKLFASNYGNLSKRKGTIFIQCTRRKGILNVSYSLDKGKALKKSFTSLGDLMRFILKKAKSDLKIEDSSDESFILYSLAVIVDRDNPFFPNLTELSEVYFGAAPGIMQEAANRNLYYKYYFLNSHSISSVLDKMKNLNGVIIKKEVSFKNSEKMFKIFHKKGK